MAGTGLVQKEQKEKIPFMVKKTRTNFKPVIYRVSQTEISELSRDQDL